MSSYFVDTSALAKRYIIENGTRWKRNITRSMAHHEIIVSELAMVEMFALIERRQRMVALVPSTATRLRSAFVRHLKNQYLGIQIDTSILHSARQLVRKHPLRTLDAIQLASALQSSLVLKRPIIFVSADNDLLIAAASEGFSTDNPNLHP